MLSCLSNTTSGDAIILGDSIAKNSFGVKEKISVSPQETAVAPNLTVRENLRLMTGLHGNNKKDAVKKPDEIIRDSLNLAFGIGFPLAILLLLSVIQSNVPVRLFEIDNLAPRIAVFSFSLISLFSGIFIAKDRSTSFLMRLFSSPLTGANFILGYTLPLLPFAMMQSAICFVAAFFLGLSVSINLLVVFVVLIPASVLFIAIGLLAGSLLTDKQVGGVCGALLTNLSAWLSGTWFDLNLVAGAFKQVANALPFVHAVEAGKAALAGNYEGAFPHLWWVMGYAV